MFSIELVRCWRYQVPVLAQSSLVLSLGCPRGLTAGGAKKHCALVYVPTPASAADQATAFAIKVVGKFVI